MNFKLVFLRKLHKLIRGLCAINRLSFHSHKSKPCCNDLTFMEPKTHELLYLDEPLIFNRKQTNIWTVDKESAGRVWYVNFLHGDCKNSLLDSYAYVRAVR